MTVSRIPISPVVGAAAREPAIVTWNRLEGRPRGDLARSLRAEVRDPLWLLARQWQVGEFAGANAGSPVRVQVTAATQTFRAGTTATDVEQTLEPGVSIEPWIEYEAPALDLKARVQAGQHWLRLLSSELGDDRYRKLFVAAFPLAVAEADVAQYARAAQWLAATKARAVDGAQLYIALSSGTRADSISATGMSVAASDGAKVMQAASDFLVWYGRRFDLPALASNWSAESLEYRFGLVAGTGGGETRLIAAEYTGADVEWHTFDVDATSSPSAAAPPPTTTLGYVPTPISFVGMPRPRWWEVEDQRLDFGALDAHTTDLVTLLLAEFGLVYGNDWSIIPYSLPVGSVCQITSVVVTDVFGQQTIVPPAQADGSGWAMFALANADRARSLLVLAPTATRVVESPPIEKVCFLRDEMANLVWAIEQVVPDQLGAGIDAFSSSGTSSVGAPASPPTDAGLKYTLMGSVPAPWIPFVPSHVTGSNREIQLRRGGMPQRGGGVVQPRGVILAPTGLTHAYTIHEEEVSRAGATIWRCWKRARSHDGNTHIWIGRRRGVGKGDGSSGLRFDVATTNT